MKRLTILFDYQCALCRRCQEWLITQPSFVELEFIPFQWTEAKNRFPGLDALHPEEQLIVISDRGEVWRGINAWILCLWALREYREWSLRLAHPVLKPFARQVCEMISSRRHDLGRWFLHTPPEQAAKMMACREKESCKTC